MTARWGLGRLGRSSGWSFGGQLARAALNAGLFLVAARVLGVDGFGMFASCVALVALVAPFANLGAMSVLIRRNAHHPEQVAADYWSAVVASVGCGLVVSGGLSAAAAALGPRAVPGGVVLLIAVADLVGYRLAELAGAALQSRDWILGTAYFPPLVTLGRLVGIVIAWWVAGHVGLLDVVVAYAVWSMAVGVLVVIGTGMVIGIARPRPLSFLRHWREGLLYSVGLSSQSVYNDIDKVMLVNLYSVQGAGIYAAAYRAIDLAFVPMRAVLSATYVRFFRAGADGTEKPVAMAVSLLAPSLLVSGLASVALFASADLIPVLLGAEYADAVWVVRLLAVIPILRTLHYLAADSLTGGGRQGARTLVQVGAAVVNVGANVVLIPAFGIAGAIVTSILADLGLAVVLWALAWSVLRRARASESTDQARTTPSAPPSRRTATAFPGAPSTASRGNGSRASAFFGGVRAWMVVLPVDLLLMLTPLLWTTQQTKATVAMAILSLLLLTGGGRYRARLHLSILAELPMLSARLLTAAATIATVIALRHGQEDVRTFLGNAALVIGMVIAGRVLSTRIIAWSRKRRITEHRTVLIGGGALAAELTQILAQHPRYGLSVVGFVDDGDDCVAEAVTPKLGGLGDLDAAVTRSGADVLLIADGDFSERHLLDVVRSLDCMPCDLLVVPRMHHFAVRTGSGDHIGSIPVMRIRTPKLQGPSWAVKRAFDVVFAGTVLLLSAPLLALCALAIRIEGGPGVIFRQRRVGRHGALFDCLKLRSMRPVDERESATNWTVAGDRRVGPFGRILRRTSIDELPQMWNIIKGDMTLVGPRPERPHFVDKFSAQFDRYAHRHRVRAGLTGLAQVSGLRGDTSIADRARYDNYYIEHWSLWLDIKIVIRTFLEVFLARGR